MSLENLVKWVIGIVMASAAVGHLDTLQSWIWRAQAKVVIESRTSTWGSPRFFNVSKPMRPRSDGSH
jgi:hypothetical protein